MAKAKNAKEETKSSKNLFELKKDARPNPKQHVFGNKIRCDTDQKGSLRPRGTSELEIVLDATEGFVPLWAKGVHLRWRFRPGTFAAYANPTAGRNEVTRLMGRAVMEWGDAAPITFVNREDAWDFEVVVRKTPDCDLSGCVLASAFFPDSGRHKLVIYPTMFEKSEDEQIATLAHEFGHVFGLRHFFANISETEWASEIFGVHHKFTIMNYGPNSFLTDHDKNDLKRLYEMVWDGALTDVNGTPVRLVQPFHSLGAGPESMVAIRQVVRNVVPGPVS